jgi:hypothetical protein
LIGSLQLQHVAATAFEDAVIRKSSHHDLSMATAPRTQTSFGAAWPDRLAVAAMLVRMPGLEIAR